MFVYSVLLYTVHINETDSSYEGSSFTNGGIVHHEEGTPQRRVFCTPKSMGGEMGMLPREQGDGRNCELNTNCVTTIAGLVQNHDVAMETDLTEQNQRQSDSVELRDENPPAISQPVKRTSSEDTNTGSTLTVDEVSNRPFKRRRKLIAANTEPEKDREEISTVEENSNHKIVEENSSIVKEAETEEAITPGNNLKSQITDNAGVTGSVKKIPMFTSTPNNATHNDDIDSSIEADTGITVPPVAYHYKRRRVLRRAPAGDHVTVTGSDGTRVYLRMSKEPKKQDKQERPKRYQLLSVPFYQLRHEIESKVL